MVTTEAAVMGVTLFPAIDLRRGRCVRLEQGLAERETAYSSDPFQIASDFAAQGAQWLHIVDLDAAFGEGSNQTLIRELAETVPLAIQSGGGLRSEDDLARVLDGPVRRAVIGTAAIENPALVELAVERWGAERVAVGLDARGLRPATRGWREESGEDLFSLASSLTARGVRTLIYTDIDRDGMLSGPNVATSAQLSRESGAEVIVSGGVGGPRDLEAIARAGREHPGITGVIVGKALYEGHLDVASALALLR